MCSIDLEIEALTERCAEDAFSDIHDGLECDQCCEIFYNEKFFVSDLREDKTFCSQECLDEWEKENKEDYKG